MNSFETKSLCIFGRLPALGLAELESLYGPEHINPLNNAALLDIEAGDINFKRLGGTIKVARVLNILNTTKWSELEKYLIVNIPDHLQHVPEGKFTLGLSVYGLPISVNDINKSLLNIKKIIRKPGRPVRVVPNKTPELNSAQVLHNKLTHRGAWELLLVANGDQTILAQTFFVQDIEAYAARDQARPKRDARVGMLPPKLAQTIINLANPPAGATILDPFCGTGVVLQEALLMGYSVVGTDIDERMVAYAKENIDWLKARNPEASGKVEINQGDATTYKWQAQVGAVASETYLGRPFSAAPAGDVLRQVISDVNTIHKKFLANIAPQLKSGTPLALAVPAWRVAGQRSQKLHLDGAQGAVEQRTEVYGQYSEGAAQAATQRSAKSSSRAASSASRQAGAVQFLRLPVLDHLTDMGYTYWDLKHVPRENLIYYREDQIVARQLIILRKS